MLLLFRFHPLSRVNDGEKGIGVSRTIFHQGDYQGGGKRKRLPIDAGSADDEGCRKIVLALRVLRMREVGPPASPDGSFQ